MSIVPRQIPELSAGDPPPLVKLGTILLVVAVNGLDGVIPPAGVPLALLTIWLIHRRTNRTWADIGLGRPSSWRRTVLQAVGITAVLYPAATFGIDALLELLGMGTPDASRFDVIKGNPGQLAMYLTISWTTAGFGEEVIWRGFVMGGVAAVLGGSRAAWILALIGVSAIFGALHLYQGAAGVLATGLVGLVLGIIYLVSGRNLWLPILIHALIDSTAFTLLFFGIDF